MDFHVLAGNSAEPTIGAGKTSQGEPVDYHAAVAGGLRLVPDDDALIDLRADYQHMVDDGLLLDVADSFENLLDRCRVIENRANKQTSR